MKQEDEADYENWLPDKYWDLMQLDGLLENFPFIKKLIADE